MRWPGSSTAAIPSTELEIAIIKKCVERHRYLEMHFDKRYTTRLERLKFERDLRESIAEAFGAVVTISQDDSIALKELQAVDFVAWAAGERAKGINEFWQLIQPSVVVDEIVHQEKW